MIPIRIPELLRRLRTHPGGHRSGRFDPRIRQVWTLLVHATEPGASTYEHAGIRPTDETRFELQLNVTKMADTLGVDRKTLRGWLDFMERHRLLSTSRRYGGRGQGICVRLTWLERGVELARRREQAEAKRREQNGKKPKTGEQGQNDLHPTGDFKNRAGPSNDADVTHPVEDQPSTVPSKRRLMAQARLILCSKIQEPAVAQDAVVAFGRWFWKERPRSDQATRVLKALQVPEWIPVPRWVSTAQDVFRWIRGLIGKLLQWGARWWERFKTGVERRRLKAVLAQVKRAVEAGKPCPVCNKRHSRWDWEEGRNENGSLNCAGWARVKLDDLIVAAHNERKTQRPPRRAITVEDRWAEWREERAQQAALKRQRAKEAREKIRTLRQGDWGVTTAG